jgi:hypothetical protein
LLDKGYGVADVLNLFEWYQSIVWPLAFTNAPVAESKRNKAYSIQPLANGRHEDISGYSLGVLITPGTLTEHDTRTLTCVLLIVRRYTQETG